MSAQINQRSDVLTAAQAKRQLMRLDVKHPPEVWERMTGVHIIDADGWRNEGNDYATPVTRDDFLCKAASSTASYPKSFFKSLKD